MTALKIRQPSAFMMQFHRKCSFFSPPIKVPFKCCGLSDWTFILMAAQLYCLSFNMILDIVGI